MCQYDSLAGLYEIWSTADPSYIPSHDFYVQVSFDAERDIVELGIGTGRIAVDIAKEGKIVTGIDVSSRMLEQCRINAKAAGVDQQIKLIQSDIREFNLSEKADLIILPFRSIGHLLTIEDKRDALYQIFRNLTPGGKFIFDHYVFNEEWAHTHHGIPRLMKVVLNSENKRQYIWDIYLYDFTSQLIQCYIVVEKTDSKGKLIEKTYNSLNFSWIYPKQIKELAEETGFEIESLYGDFSFGNFTDNSCDQIWVLRRPI